MDLSFKNSSARGSVSGARGGWHKAATLHDEEASTVAKPLGSGRVGLKSLPSRCPFLRGFGAKNSERRYYLNPEYIKFRKDARKLRCVAKTLCTQKGPAFAGRPFL
jgi:hypothetical protein